MKMSRKFSNSEIRAYAKNRHEDTILRLRLEKLKEDIGSFQDSIAKNRQNLVSECKDTRMTSGESPVPKGFSVKNIFDLRERVKCPWAYSVTETTYNVIYRDAVIQLPKRNRQPKRKLSATPSSSTLAHYHSINDSKSDECFSAKTQCSPTHFYGKLYATCSQNSHDCLRPTTSMSKSFLNPVVCSEIVENEYCGENDETRNDAAKVSMAFYRPEIIKDINITEHGENKQPVEDDQRNGEESLNSYLTEPNTSPIIFPKTTFISLPPVYKIDSKNYQDAERERTVARSRSRVSFTHNTVSKTETSSDRAVSAKKPNDGVTEEVRVDITGKLIASVSFEKDATNNTVSQFTLQDTPVKTYVNYFDGEVNGHKKDTVYKGLRLRNYIRPEDRYKLDPLIINMRPNVMDKLAKESETFLKRVTHENINVEIAFPRSVRQRMLAKLVQENNCTKGKIVSDVDTLVIREKVQRFMSSISEYIEHQKMEIKLSSDVRQKSEVHIS